MSRLREERTRFDQFSGGAQHRGRAFQGAEGVEGGDLDPSAAPATFSPTAHLVRDARDHGNSAAFGQLVTRFERTALSVAMGCTGDASLAGDVTQEAFLRAWRRLAELKDDEKFPAWLCGIVRNVAADARRARGRATNMTAGEEAAAMQRATPDAHLQSLERADQIAWALGQLDWESRTAVVLRYYQGLRSAQIAELTDSTPAAVDMRLSRARRRLRELLGDDEVTDACPERSHERGA